MLGQRYHISGTVTSIDNRGLEPADRDWILLSIRVVLILCLGFFILVWRICTHRSLGVSLILGYLLFGRGQKQVPVQYFRIRDISQNLHVVRSKGYIDGQIMVGDRVVAEGHLRDSVLHLSVGRNLTTGTSFRVRRK